MMFYDSKFKSGTDNLIFIQVANCSYIPKHEVRHCCSLCNSQVSIPQLSANKAITPQYENGSYDISNRVNYNTEPFSRT